MSVTPYHVGIVPIQYEGSMKVTADRLHDELTARGIEVLLDDRVERPGVKFKDMDLIGLPMRLVISDKKLPNVEFKFRADKGSTDIPLDRIVDYVVQRVQSELTHYSL